VFSICERADDYVAVHVTVETDIAYRAAIYAATVRLELFDDLHCSQFGCTGDRSAGEAVTQHMQGIAPFGQFSFHRTDQVVHVGISFYFE
jgi:hypothetical protein